MNSKTARPTFIADADLSKKIVIGIRKREPLVDFLTAREGCTLGLPDPAVLARGTATGRIVVSSDQSTMPGHFWRFLDAHDSPGMIIVPQVIPLSRAIDELLRIWAESDAQSLSNQIHWVKERN